MTRYLITQSGEARLHAHEQMMSAPMIFARTHVGGGAGLDSARSPA